MSPHNLREWDNATSAWRKSPRGKGRPNSSIRRREEPPESVIATMAQRFRVTFLSSESIVNEPVPPPTVTTQSDPWWRITRLLLCVAYRNRDDAAAGATSYLAP